MSTIEIIAEIGQNHNGDMAMARSLIQEAKRAGADVAKFQIYNAKALFPKENNPWYDYNLSTELSREQLLMLVDECAKIGIEFMASVFDEERVEWLEAVGVKRYKIASRSIFDTSLIQKICDTQKPIIASLGHWTSSDFPTIHSKKIDYLYCISHYPTDLSSLKFGLVDFSRYSGFSDHTIGLSASKIAISRGAKIIEKHFTLDKNMYGPDHTCSMNIDELKQLSDFKNDFLASL